MSIDEAIAHHIEPVPEDVLSSYTEFGKPAPTISTRFELVEIEVSNAATRDRLGLDRLAAGTVHPPDSTDVELPSLRVVEPDIDPEDPVVRRRARSRGDRERLTSIL